MKDLLMKIAALVSFICITAGNFYAQDTIVKKDNETIKVKIIEIGTDEVKYKYFDAPDGPTIVISKSDVRSLKIKGADDKMVSVITAEPESAPAPDIIIKKDNEQLKVKVIEIGPTTVKYRYFDAPNGPVIVMEKRDIKSIKIKGKADKAYDTISNEPDPMSTSNAAILDKTSSLKFNFFSPLSHHLAFSYEWMIKPGFNWEAGMGIVGPGVGLSDNFSNTHPKGFFLRTGPKFLLGNSSDVEGPAGERYAHPLKGRYFKIEAILYTLSKTYESGYYSLSYVNSSTTVKNDYLGVALMLIYGRQFIFGNSITVGYYVGFGYGFENKTTTFATTPIANYSDYDPARYSHSYLGERFPLAFTSGFTVGYIFKTPDWISRPKWNEKPPTRHSLKND